MFVMRAPLASSDIAVSTPLPFTMDSLPHLVSTRLAPSPCKRSAARVRCATIPPTNRVPRHLPRRMSEVVRQPCRLSQASESGGRGRHTSVLVWSETWTAVGTEPIKRLECLPYSSLVSRRVYPPVERQLCASRRDRYRWSTTQVFSTSSSSFPNSAACDARLL